MSAWQLKRFGECLDAWDAGQRPDDELRRIVTAWVLSRFDDPYQGVRREPDFPNLWFGMVPGSRRAGLAVACSYWIFEREHVVRCDSIATLGLPF